MFSPEISSSDISEYILFTNKKYFFIHKNQFLVEKIKNVSFSSAVFFFFKLLPKLIDFINSEDCIGKITPKTIKIKPVFN